LVFPTAVSKSDPLGYEWWIINKHLPGKHDQALHGRKKSIRLTGGSRDGLVFDVEEDDVAHSEATLEALRNGRKIKYMQPEGGSYYAGIDWDSDVDPVAQMFDSFEATTGIDVTQIRMRSSELNVEAVAEALDALDVLEGEWSYKPDRLVYDGSTNAIAYVLQISADSMTLAFGNSFLQNNAERITRLYERDQSSHLNPDNQNSTHFAPSQATAFQYVMTHEYGHVVKSRMQVEDPEWLFLIEAETLVPLANAGMFNRQIVDNPRSELSNGRIQFSGDPASDVEVWTTRVYPEVFSGSIVNQGLMSRGTAPTPFGNVDTASIRLPVVSDYSLSNGQELFAEVFAMSYTNWDNTLLRSSNRVINRRVDGSLATNAPGARASTVLPQIRDTFTGLFDEYYASS
jgi:hypothetical protein